MELHEERLAQAISSKSRRDILRLLIDKELKVKDIAQKTNMSVSLASRHLKMLFYLGFLNMKKKYPYKFYSLKIKEIKQLLKEYDKILKKL